MTPSMTAEELEAAVRLAQQLVDEGGRYNLRGTNLQSVYRALLAATTSLARVMPVVEAAVAWMANGDQIDALPEDRVPIRLLRLRWETLENLRTAITAMRGENP